MGDALKVALYYFTGTGNCLAVARMVSARFGCRPVSIADVADGSRCYGRVDDPETLEVMEHEECVGRSVHLRTGDDGVNRVVAPS